MFSKNGVHRNFAKFTGKHLCQSLFFNEVAGLKPSTLLKKRLWHSRQRHDITLKVNESRYIALFVSNDCVKIYLLSIFFFKILPGRKVWGYHHCLYSLVPNCTREGGGRGVGRGGGVKLQIFGKKNSQLHLIIIREWILKHPPSILRNLGNFPPGTFCSIPAPYN